MGTSWVERSLSVHFSLVQALIVLERQAAMTGSYVEDSVSVIDGCRPVYTKEPPTKEKLSR